MTFTGAGTKSLLYASLLSLMLTVNVGCIRTKRPQKNDHTAYIKDAITKGNRRIFTFSNAPVGHAG